MNRVVANWIVVGLTTLLVSCAAMKNPIPLSTNVQYDLSGRIRVLQEGSILRADFRMRQTSTETHVLFTGPMGFGRREVISSNGSVEFVQNGEKIQLTQAEVEELIPGGNWIMSINLIDWLTLKPSEDGSGGWRSEYGQVEIRKSQRVNSQKVCKHLRISHAEVRIDLLCDRWLTFDGFEINLQ